MTWPEAGFKGGLAFTNEETLREVPLVELAGLHVLEGWALYRMGVPFYGALLGTIPGELGNRRHVLPLSSSCHIKIGQTVEITTHPQMAFQPERLMIGGDASKWCVEDFRIGGASQFALPVAGDADLQVPYDLAPSGQGISISITNVDAYDGLSTKLTVKLDGQLYRLALGANALGATLHDDSYAVRINVRRVIPGSNTFEHGDLIMVAPPRVLTFHVTEDRQHLYRQHLYATDEATGLIVLDVSDYAAPQFDLGGLKPDWMKPSKNKSGRKKQTREQRKRAKARK